RPGQAIALRQQPEDAARHQEYDRDTDRDDAANALDQPITVADRSRHQIVRGRWYFCCGSATRTRGIKSTTVIATARTPANGWTSPSPLRRGRVITLSAAGGTSAAGARGRRAASRVRPRSRPRRRRQRAGPAHHRCGQVASSDCPRQVVLLLQEPEDAARHQEHHRDTDRDAAANALDQPITVEDRSRHQIVRGRWYFCCRSPRTPRGIRSTTATPAATPPPTRLTSPSPLRTGR